ncbi:hypothetical protein TTHERM_00474920 (macronuclear) [Tetrahymena thermophila SB210]|uniref:Uncharacterized protein n=1 Tax=Tetrahymena thermophila (strain SB210) TaxID=312017 RepID=I7MA51_TETTS|nr:hypothetical protein TTHERM_00474920 [Tetrahymena thermophila SB210]EAS03729.1 hypothetical protein TTHERM_00474920 [Tetrahymena thermophila SB210]|eukprot:XP_001023974.1 hypothetical protein TTHERM_00474920 [Tetrahymena thermophila SB210]
MQETNNLQQILSSNNTKKPNNPQSQQQIQSTSQFFNKNRQNNNKNLKNNNSQNPYYRGENNPAGQSQIDKEVNMMPESGYQNSNQINTNYNQINQNQMNQNPNQINQNPNQMNQNQNQMNQNQNPMNQNQNQMNQNPNQMNQIPGQNPNFNINAPHGQNPQRRNYSYKFQKDYCRPQMNMQNNFQSYPNNRNYENNMNPTRGEFFQGYSNPPQQNHFNQQKFQPQYQGQHYYDNQYMQNKFYQNQNYENQAQSKNQDNPNRSNTDKERYFDQDRKIKQIVEQVVEQVIEQKFQEKEDIFREKLQEKDDIITDLLEKLKIRTEDNTQNTVSTAKFEKQVIQSEIYPEIHQEILEKKNQDRQRARTPKRSQYNYDMHSERSRTVESKCQESKDQITPKIGNKMQKSDAMSTLKSQDITFCCENIQS